MIIVIEARCMFVYALSPVSITFLSYGFVDFIVRVHISSNDRNDTVCDDNNKQHTKSV